jgi:hemolysin III
VNEVETVLRPALRGSLHRWSAPVAVALTVLVAVRAPTGGSRAALIVYGLGVTTMLVVSGIYHAPTLSPRPRRLLRRLDHAAIFVAIGGTYTAVIVLALDGPTRVVLLVMAWLIAGLGIIVRMVWFDAPHALVAALYVAAGWMILLDIPAYVGALSGGQLAWLAVGGGLYTVGAAAFALKWPDPAPAVFGYHEVFHTCVIGGALTQWFAVLSLAG